MILAASLSFTHSCYSTLLAATACRSYTEDNNERKVVIHMLSDIIRSIRKAKGLSQEEFAIKLYVVRQTVSKWERGLSVPDSEMLIHISEILETPVSVLLGETKTEEEEPLTELNVISEKLEVINLQLARGKEKKRKVLHGLCIAVCALHVIIAAILLARDSFYLEWDFHDPEMAVVGTFFHAFEWLFVRLAPFAFIGAIVGIVVTRQRH